MNMRTGLYRCLDTRSIEGFRGQGTEVLYDAFMTDLGTIYSHFTSCVEVFGGMRADGRGLAAPVLAFCPFLNTEGGLHWTRSLCRWLGAFEGDD